LGPKGAARGRDLLTLRRLGVIAKLGVPRFSEGLTLDGGGDYIKTNMKNTGLFVELGGYIINLDAVAYLSRDGDTLTVAFGAEGPAGPASIILNGKEADRFTELLRSNRTVVS